jgi:hypothetical protein
MACIYVLPSYLRLSTVDMSFDVLALQAGAAAVTCRQQALALV